MSAQDWDTYAICPGCQHNYRAAFGRVFFLNFEVCPNCGEPKSASTWEIRTMRWVPAGQILKPSTWGTGYWETKVANPQPPSSEVRS